MNSKPYDLLNDAVTMDTNGIERCGQVDVIFIYPMVGQWCFWGVHGLGLERLELLNKEIAIGPGVTAPILHTSVHYRPSIATLGYMFPNRVFLGLGKGEALNEVPSGDNWPSGMKNLKE